MSTTRAMRLDEIQSLKQKFDSYLQKHAAEGRASPNSISHQRYRVAEEMSLRLTYLSELMNDPSTLSSRNIQNKVQRLIADRHDKQLAASLNDLADNPMTVQQMLSSMRSRMMVFTVDPKIAQHQHLGPVKRKSPKVFTLLRQAIYSLVKHEPHLSDAERGVKTKSRKPAVTHAAPEIEHPKEPSPKEPSSESRRSDDSEQLLAELDKLVEKTDDVAPEKTSTSPDLSEAQVSETQGEDDIDKLMEEQAQEGEARKVAKQIGQHVEKYAEQMIAIDNELKAGHWDKGAQLLEALSGEQQQLRGLLALQSVEALDTHRNAALLLSQMAEVMDLRDRLMQRKVENAALSPAEKSRLRQEAATLHSQHEQLRDQSFDRYVKLDNAEDRAMYATAEKQHAARRENMALLIAANKHTTASDKPIQTGKKGRKEMEPMAPLEPPIETTINPLITTAATLLASKTENIGVRLAQAQRAIAEDRIDEARNILELLCKQTTNLNNNISAFENNDLNVKQNNDPFLFYRAIFSLQAGDAHLLMRYVLERQAQSDSLSKQDRKAIMKAAKEYFDVSNIAYTNAFNIQKNVGNEGLKNRENIHKLIEAQHQSALPMGIAVNILLKTREKQAIASLAPLKPDEPLQKMQDEVAREIKGRIDTFTKQLNQAHEAIASNNFSKAKSILTKITDQECRFIIDNIASKEPSGNKRNDRNTAILLSHTSNAVYLLGRLQQHEANTVGLSSNKKNNLLHAKDECLNLSNELLQSANIYAEAIKDRRTQEEYTKAAQQGVIDRNRSDDSIGHAPVAKPGKHLAGLFQASGRRQEGPPVQPSNPNFKKTH